MISWFFPAVLFLCINLTQSIKIFFIGGGSNENSTLVFNELARVVPGRPPFPKKCDLNWTTTACPRIAVVTSAANSSIDGNDAWSNDSDSMSYRTMFINYGMAPLHISAHRDNYKAHSSSGSPEGRANLEMLKLADVVYFNGGDQSRHVRTWMNDDGSDSDLLKVVR